MSSKPLVSIGLPIYNGEKFLRQALDELLGQDYPEIEIVASDNSSIDRTQEICQEYAQRDRRIRYLRQPKNRGPHWNFNFVLQEAKGEYFMWAATDDHWDKSFIRTLLERLEEDRTAIGAFCPHQLVEEETGKIQEKILVCNYESRFEYIRLLKFTWSYVDRCVYGLFRRKSMDRVRFRPWIGINSQTPYNTAYPVLYFLFARGNFLLAGNKPLWKKSVRVSHWHLTPFSRSPILGYLAHIIRKWNLLSRSLVYIYLGSESLLVCIGMAPVLLARCLWDCVTPIYAAIYILFSGRKLGDLSPHEIWRLGVR
jgi:glycosyltransferase involved in cell wall biosynthesis